MNPHRNPTETPRSGPTTTPRRPTAKPAGWIYCHQTATDRNKYVGQSKRPVWTRVNESRRKDPWGHEILPKRAGYRIVRKVESSGDLYIDAILLDLAEAEVIQELCPTENAYRPDPQVFRDRLAQAHAGHRPASWGRPGQAAVVPQKRPPRTPTVVRRAPRPVPWRTVGFVILAVVWGYVGLLVGVEMSNPNAPWIVTPITAVLGPALTVGVYRECTTKRRRPRCRTYRRRRR